MDKNVRLVHCMFGPWHAAVCQSAALMVQIELLFQDLLLILDQVSNSQYYIKIGVWIFWGGGGGGYLSYCSLIPAILSYISVYYLFLFSLLITLSFLIKCHCICPDIPLVSKHAVFIYFFPSIGIIVFFFRPLLCSLFIFSSAHLSSYANLSPWKLQYSQPFSANPPFSPETRGLNIVSQNAIQP